MASGRSGGLLGRSLLLGIGSVIAATAVFGCGGGSQQHTEPSRLGIPPGQDAEQMRRLHPTPESRGEPLIVRLTPAPSIVGNPEIGRRLFVTTGCAGCHTTYGIPEAKGIAGPILTNVVLRPTLAGETIPMTPQNMTRWLIEPSALKPGTTMPGVGLTLEEAQHITAYLYSQPYNPRR